jgi:hypothetical protein
MQFHLDSESLHLVFEISSAANVSTIVIDFHVCPLLTYLAGRTAIGVNVCKFASRASKTNNTENNLKGFQKHWQ